MTTNHGLTLYVTLTDLEKNQELIRQQILVSNVPTNREQLEILQRHLNNLVIVVQTMIKNKVN